MGGPSPLFLQVFIQKGFKSNVLEVFIPEGFTGVFLEVRIPKELASGGTWLVDLLSEARLRRLSAL